MAVMTRKKPWGLSQVLCLPVVILRRPSSPKDGGRISGTSFLEQMRLLRWEHILAAGASSTPWGQKSPSFAPLAGSALKALALSRFFSLLITAFPSAPRTLLPEQSLALDQLRDFPLCAGEWPKGLSGPGCLLSQRPPLWLLLLSGRFDSLCPARNSHCFRHTHHA